MTDDISPEEKTQPNKVIRKILAESQKVDAEASRTQPMIGTPGQNPEPIVPPVDGNEVHPQPFTGDTVNNASWYGEPPVSSYPYQGPTTAVPVNSQNNQTENPSGAHQPENYSYIPQRVDEVDMGATSVSPVAFQNARTEQMRPTPTPPRNVVYSPPPPNYPPPTGNRATQPRPAKKRNLTGCFMRVVIAFLFMGVFLAVAVGAFLVYQYFSIAAGLPSVDDLRNRATQFETTRIYDRSGAVIYEIIDPNAGRHTYMELDKISRYLLAATIATEDKEFLTHPGFDLWAIARAMWQNYTSGRIASGASTITQQLARGLLLSPEEVNERTIRRKSREIVLAAEITR
ncbi:MAG: hypothetical protein HGA86_08320, partial [Anaerolineaceae bacterium]|nr:hypothetical protein [Anaerolineaceae bacterium]